MINNIEMRQTRLTQFMVSRPNGRITRGYSDIPKEQSKPEEIQQSESEEEPSNEPPKEKKIHHMTLKALERRKQLELAGLLPEKPAEDVPKIPKKRGRPKGYKVKKIVEKEEFQPKQESIQPEEPSQKKEVALRKRDISKRIKDQDSEILQKQLDQVEPMEQQQPKKIQPEPIPAPKLEALQPSVPPKKRGRKKKVIIEPPINQIQPANTQKVYTKPKSQTYDNYLKYFDCLMNETKEVKGPEISLIFNKFQDPAGYTALVKSLK